MIELIIILRKAILDNWLIAFLIGLHDAILIDKLCAVGHQLRYNVKSSLVRLFISA